MKRMKKERFRLTPMASIVNYFNHYLKCKDRHRQDSQSCKRTLSWRRYSIGRDTHRLLHIYQTSSQYWIVLLQGRLIRICQGLHHGWGCTPASTGKSPPKIQELETKVKIDMTWASTWAKLMFQTLPQNASHWTNRVRSSHGMWLRRRQLCWKEVEPWDTMRWVCNSNAWGICCWPFRTKYHRCKKTGSMRKPFYSFPLKRQVFDRSIMWVALCTNWFLYCRSRSFFKIQSLQLRWTVESKLIRYHWFPHLRGARIYTYIFSPWCRRTTRGHCKAWGPSRR